MKPRFVSLQHNDYCEECHLKDKSNAERRAKLFLKKNNIGEEEVEAEVLDIDVDEDKTVELKWHLILDKTPISLKIAEDFIQEAKKAYTTEIQNIGKADCTILQFSETITITGCF